MLLNNVMTSKINYLTLFEIYDAYVFILKNILTKSFLKEENINSKNNRNCLTIRKIFISMGQNNIQDDRLKTLYPLLYFRLINKVYYTFYCAI